MDQIALFFKCQSCLDYVLTSNIQCPNGHQVCQGCFENLSHCPTCHQRVAPSTRIPFILTTNVDPILNVGDSFDLLLPSLLRIAPALHPCGADELIFSDKQAESTLNLLDNDLEATSMQSNNNMADQLLMANSFEVEQTLSRLMMLASMSPGASPQQTSMVSPASSQLLGGGATGGGGIGGLGSVVGVGGGTSNSSVPVPPPGLISSSAPVAQPSLGQLGLISSVQQYLDRKFH